MRVQAVQTQTPHKSHTALKVASVITAGAAATGALLYAAKMGKLNPTEGGNKVVEAVKATLKKPADQILAAQKFQSAVSKVKTAKNFATSKLSSVKDQVRMIRAKFNPDLAPVAEKTAETFNNFV